MSSRQKKWEQRNLDDSKASQGFKLQTRNLGEISAESLYKTTVSLDRDRHTTARYGSGDAEYKPSSSSAQASDGNPGDVARAGSRTGSRAGSRAATAKVQPKEETRRQRQSSRATRERDGDHLSELLAKRLQSIEVRQAGLDESALASRFNSEEDQAVAEALAKQLLADDEKALEEARAEAARREEEDLALARMLAQQDEPRGRQDDCDMGDDAALAKLLQEEEERAAGCVAPAAHTTSPPAPTGAPVRLQSQGVPPSPLGRVGSAIAGGAAGASAGEARNSTGR